MSNTQFVATVQHGAYFYPANKRYGFTGAVTCDRCSNTNLPACLGFHTIDLCMRCVFQLTPVAHYDDTVVAEEQPQPPRDTQNTTTMRQSMLAAQPPQPHRTRMRQQIFATAVRPSTDRPSTGMDRKPRSASPRR